MRRDPSRKVPRANADAAAVEAEAGVGASWHISPVEVRNQYGGLLEDAEKDRWEEKEEEDDEMRCGICDDRGDEEEECQGCEGCGPVIEVWPQIGEEVHTNSCPHRLMECVECESIMAQYHLLEHECPVMDKPMQTRDIDWADHEDESICGCERNRKKEKVKAKEKPRKGKDGNKEAGVEEVNVVEGGAGGGCRGTDPPGTADPTLEVAWAKEDKGKKGKRGRVWRKFVDVQKEEQGRRVGRGGRRDRG